MIYLDLFKTDFHNKISIF